jgi:hypothetical protein
MGTPAEDLAAIRSAVGITEDAAVTIEFATNSIAGAVLAMHEATTAIELSAGSLAAYIASLAVKKYRNPVLQPYDAKNPFNLGFCSGVLFEEPTAIMTKALLAGNPQINRERWSFTVSVSDNNDPINTLTHQQYAVPPASGTGLIYATYQLRVDAALTATAGTDRPVAIIQPDGKTVYEAYKYQRQNATHISSTSVKINDITGLGMTNGARASNTSILLGLIRTHEVAAKLIPHALAVGIPNSMLKLGYVYPARGQDRQIAPTDTTAGNIYAGPIPMGTMLGIPLDIDLTALGLSPEGLAMGRALQGYGAFVIDQSSTVAAYVEPNADLAAVARMRLDYQTKLFPLLRVVRNSSATSVNGGGTPLHPLALPFTP